MICKLQNHPFIDKLSWYDIRNVQDIIRWRDNLSHNKSWHFFTAFLCCRNIHWVRRPPIVMNRVQLKIHNHDFMFIMQCRFCNNSGLELVIFQRIKKKSLKLKPVRSKFCERLTVDKAPQSANWLQLGNWVIQLHYTTIIQYIYATGARGSFNCIEIWNTDAQYHTFKCKLRI